MNLQVYRQLAGSGGRPAGTGVRGVQPAEIVQICTIMGLPPKCWALTPSTDAVGPRWLGFGVCPPGWRQVRQAHPVPTDASLSTFVPSVGQTMFAQRAVPCLAGMAATPQSWECPTGATAHARDGRDPAWS
jgi:hypothetical protein